MSEEINPKQPVQILGSTSMFNHAPDQGNRRGLFCGRAELELCRGGKTKMDSLLNTCAWCSKEVPEDSEVCSITATTKYKTLLEGHEGTFIPLPLTLASKTVPAAVVTSDSEAKKDGWDIIFMTCGLSCAKSLKAALNSESGIGKVSH